MIGPPDFAFRWQSRGNDSERCKASTLRYPYFTAKSRFIFGIVFRGNESVQFYNNPALPE